MKFCYYIGMQIYPVLPAIQKNELLVSYLIRLANANNKIYSGNSDKSFFPTTWIGAGPVLENIAKQLDMDVIDLILDHTVFGWYQLFMTRTEHKNTVRNIFSRTESKINAKRLVQMPDDLKGIWFCKKCLKEDYEQSKVRYVRRDLQLSPGWCMEHDRQSFYGKPYIALAAEMDTLPGSTIPVPYEMPTALDNAMYHLAKALCNERILVNGEDAMMLIEAEFESSELVTLGTSLDLYNKDAKFSRSSYRQQVNYLSDAYGYYEAAKEKGFTLSGVHNLMTGLLAECYPTIEQLKTTMPSNEDVYTALVVKAANMGYELITNQLQPIIRIKDIETGLEYIVSAYEVLDEETRKRNESAIV